MVEEGGGGAAAAVAAAAATSGAVVVVLVVVVEVVLPRCLLHLPTSAWLPRVLVRRWTRIMDVSQGTERSPGGLPTVGCAFATAQLFVVRWICSSPGGLSSGRDAGTEHVLGRMSRWPRWGQP